MDRDVEVIDVAHSNTVRTLRDQLARVDAAGYADTGFPIIRTDENRRAQMLGFIGGNELEHALSAPTRPSIRVFALMLILFFSVQASSQMKRIILYRSTRITGGTEPFLHHPSQPRP